MRNNIECQYILCKFIAIMQSDKNHMDSPYEFEAIYI